MDRNTGIGIHAWPERPFRVRKVDLSAQRALPRLQGPRSPGYLSLELAVIQRLDTDACHSALAHQDGIGLRDIHEDAYQIHPHDHKERLGLSAAARARRLKEMTRVDVPLTYDPIERCPDLGILQQGRHPPLFGFGHQLMIPGSFQVRFGLVPSGLGLTQSSFGRTDLGLGEFAGCLRSLELVIYLIPTLLVDDFSGG